MPMILRPTYRTCSELSDYLAYVVFVLYHLSSYSTSLIEEEHDIWLVLEVVLFSESRGLSGCVRTRTAPSTDLRTSPASNKFSIYAWVLRFFNVILHKMATIVRTPEKSGYSSETSGVALLCLHRLAMSFTSHTRRRWSMRQGGLTMFRAYTYRIIPLAFLDVLPPPILPEFRFNVQLLEHDFNDRFSLSRARRNGYV
ncbi:hypothetical protein COOONC_09018 [Cooperia oncophora]